MISKISIKEFRERLIENTKYGNPKIKGTPFAIFSVFGETKKKFYGSYNNTEFKLTKNATFFAAPFIIFGEINAKNNTQTEISYQVKPIGFGYYWMKYMPIFAIIIFNLILYFESTSIKVYRIINPILFIFISFSHYYMWRTKKNLIAEFRKVFEIEGEIYNLLTTILHNGLVLVLPSIKSLLLKF